MGESCSSVPWLQYNTDHRSIICSPCQRGIQHPGLATHLREQHRDVDLTNRRRLLSYYESKTLVLSDLFSPPSQPITRIPTLPFYSDGLKCTEDGCSYLCRSRSSIAKHYQDQHRWRNPYTKGGSLRQRRDAIYPWQQNVLCQRLFTSGKGQGYFEIKQDTREDPGTYGLDQAKRTDPTDNIGETGPIDRGEEIELSTRERVLNQLSAFESERSRQTTIRAADSTEANPWLRKTGWDEHLQGYRLEDLAPLVDLPRPDELILKGFCASVDRTIEEARGSIFAQRINIFDQTAINMFNDHQTKAGQPLHTKLQDGTYAKYKIVWKKLLCFIYRLQSSPVSESDLDLPYRLTHNQQTAFNRSVRLGRELSKQTDDSPINRTKELRAGLDTILLRFSVVLLDHQLRGNIYESFLIGFLAVLGIDIENVSNIHIYIIRIN